MNKTFLFVFVVLFGFNLFAQSNDLIRIIENDKIGYINSKGKIVIQPIYKIGNDFSENLASVREHDKYGFIDKNGEYIIEPKFDIALDFKNGIAKVFLKGEAMFIDKKGEIAIPPNYTSLDFINNNLAIVTTTSNAKGVLNIKTRKLVIDTIYNSISNFENEVAVVHKRENSEEKKHQIYKPAVIDINGKIIVPFNVYTEIYEFNNGIANVKFHDNKSNEYIDGFINYKGDLLFKDSYTGDYFLPDYFKDEIGIVSIKRNLKDGSYTYYDGYMNSNGKIILSDTLNSDLKDFSCGRAFIKDANGEYKVVDKNLNKIGNNTFKYFLGEGFINNYAVVCNDDKCGVIDLNGNYVVEPSYDTINAIGVVNGYFYYGIENVNDLEDEDETGVLWGVANLNGKSIIKPIFHEFDRKGFIDGVLKTSINNKLVYFNEKGNIIWEEPSLSSLNLKDLDIDYMNRGYFRAYSKPNEDDFGGFGSSRNIPIKITDERFPVNKLSLIVHTQKKDTIFQRYNAHRVTLSNLTNKEIKFSAQDSRLYMKVQAKDENNNWRDIEYLPSSWCGNSYHTLTLDKDYYWNFETPVYTGGFKTKLRIELIFQDFENKDKENSEIIVYSNEYDGSINPGQFWNKLEYFPNGIMDPYYD